MRVHRYADVLVTMKLVVTDEKCAECGGFKFNKRLGKRYLYRHTVAADADGLFSLTFDDPHLFCDSRCREAFYKVD